MAQVIKALKVSNVASPAEELFARLNTADDFTSLIGESESIFLDCKEWPSNENDAQKTFAKAACGLVNAEGGVLIVGLIARSKSKDEPDVIISSNPVADTRIVKSKLLQWIGQLVEPLIVGVDAHEISEASGTQSGFVTVYIPAADGGPRRSRKDWKFYLRIGSGTYPMEYFQIADMFGRRPSPSLTSYLESEEIPKLFHSNRPARTFQLGLVNTGRGIAKFPSLRFRSALGLTVISQRDYGLPLRSSETKWITFRGGVDDVIYPGERRFITQIRQFGDNEVPYNPTTIINLKPLEHPWISPWTFRTVDFECEIYAEGIPMKIDALHILEIVETIAVAR